MEILRGESWWRTLLGRMLLGVFFTLLTITLGINVVQFFGITPTLPVLFMSFAPSLALFALLAMGLLAQRYSGSFPLLLPLPHGSPRLMVLSLLVLVVAAALIAIGSVLSIQTWGLVLAAPVLLSVLALLGLFCLSLFSVVNALALYFAVWPLLLMIRTSVHATQAVDLYQSILIVPMVIPSGRLGGVSIRPIADSAWGQIALISPEVLFLLVITMGWLLSWRRHRSAGPTRTPLDGAIVVLLAAGLVSALLSEAPLFSLVWYLQELVSPVLVCYLVIFAVRSEGDLLRVLGGMLGALAFMVFYHLFDIYQATGTADLSTALVFSGLRYHPVFFSPAYSRLLVWLLPAPLIFLARRQWGVPGRTAMIGITGAALISIVVAFERHVLILLFVFFAFLFWVQPRTRPILATAGVLLGVTLLLSWSNLSELTPRLRPDLATPEKALAGPLERLYGVRRSLELLASPLILGVGPGMSPSLNLVYISPTGYRAPVVGAPNTFLEIGVETGLVGLGAFAVLVALATWHCYRAMRALAPSPYREALQFISAALISYLFQAAQAGVGLTTDYAGIGGGVLGATLLGVILASRYPRPEEGGRSLRYRGSTPDASPPGS